MRLMDEQFLLDSSECECDADFRCPNHDTEAESAYWAAQYVPSWLTGNETLAYEPNDPKAFIP